MDNPRSLKPVSAEAAGALVVFLETGALESRRRLAVRRLRQLRDSADFASLPDDLRERIREIVAAGKEP